MKLPFLIISIFLSILVIPIYKVYAQQDWAQLHSQLKQAIDNDYQKPPDSETQLEVWLSWIDKKGADRKKVNEVLKELSKLSDQNPDNQEYKKWEQEFFNLLLYAEDSGTRTVNGASMKFLRIDNDAWDITSRKVRDYGRPIFERAKAYSFNTHYPRERSRCMINYSIGDLESSVSGGGLYSDRKLLFGYLDDEGLMNLPDRDFDVECERREEFERFSEGKPQKPIDWAIDQIDLLREECDWWEFSAERQDATDLLNEYYEDALCKTPPHKYKMGHKYFRKIISETDGTEKSVEYNEGFYGTLYGKVEIKEFGEIKPAPCATVIVNDYEESWTVTADSKGNYEIKNIILHKDCSPFEISAVYEGDILNDTYYGPLEKPDKSYRHKKDLLILPNKEYNWTGQISIDYWELKDCAIEKSTKSSNTSIVDQEERRQKANLSIMAKDEGDYRALTQFIFNDMQVTGKVYGKNYSEREATSSSKSRRSYEHKRIIGYGTFDVNQNELIVQVISEALTDADKYEQMVKDIIEGGYDPEEIEKANEKVDKILGGGEGDSFPVKVIVQLHNLKTVPCNFIDYRETWHQGQGTKVELDQKGFVDAPITIPLIVTMDGTYYKRKDGEDKVEANYSKTEAVPDNNKDCPPIQKSLSANFTMYKKRTK